MRVVITSDLKYQESDRPILLSLARNIADLSPDVTILAGNIGQGVENIENALVLFDNVSGHKAAILGNMDVWNRSSGLSSESLWTQALPELLHDHGFSYLESSNLVVNRVAFCGTTAWYDYSGRDSGLKYTVEQYQELKGLVNFDAQYVDWAWSDQAFAGHLQTAFLSRLEELERNHEVDHIIIVTHFPVFSDAMIHDKTDLQWNFGSAYAFNLALGRAIAPRKKVRHVVSGHIRDAGEWSIAFGMNAFKFHVIGRDDHAPRIVTFDL